MSQEEAGGTLGDYGHMLRRRWVYPATILPGILLAAIFIAYLISPKYRSSGTIMLEPSSIPEKLVPTTVTGIEDVPAYADQQLDLVRRRVLTEDRLTELVKKVDPFPGEKMSSREKAKLVADNTSIERVDPITLEPLEESMAFSIHYANPNPKVAAAIATEIVNLFITYNRRTRAEQAAAAYEFFSSQAKGLETSMQGMERRLEEFKVKYGAALPEAQVRNLAGIERSQRDLDDLQREIRLAEEKESLLALQLGELSPSVTAAVSDWRAELAKLRAELALAEQRYTPEHPDVKRLKRAVADLAAQGAASNAMGQSKPDNPDYLRVQSQLSAARGDLQALRSSAGRARGELVQYERSVTMSPSVEREYRQLTRDYENTMGRYQDVQGKLKSAALAQDLEGEARGERFTLVRSPFVPEAPFSPNRLGIILLGFVLGAGLAFGAAAIAEASDPTVRGSSDLQALMDTSALGAVPLLMNQADRRRRSFVWTSAAAIYLLVIIIVATTAVVRAAVPDSQPVQTYGH